MFVKLDLPWIRYPFTKKQYKIVNEDEITAIQKYGIHRLVIDTEKSDLSDHDMQKFRTIDKKTGKRQSGSARPNSAQSREKHDHNGHVERKIKKLDKSKNAYHETCNEVNDIFNNISSNRKEGLLKSRELVTEISNEIEKDSETFIHVLNLHFKKTLFNSIPSMCVYCRLY